MIARHNNSLLYQHIKWKSLTKYIDKLKSRKHKAFFQELHIYILQNDLVNFPLLILSSYKYYISDIDSQLNSFELGYIIYCFSSIRYLDISFFYYYRNILDLKLFNFVKCFVERVHHRLIFLSFQTYSNYLKYLCSIFYCSSYKQDINLQKHESLLNLDLNSFINLGSLSVFFNKVYIDNDLVQYLLKFFDISTFGRLLTSLSLKQNSLFLKKNKLFSKLQEIVKLQLTYELLNLLSRFYIFQYLQIRVVFFDENIEILLLHDPALTKRIAYFLFGNGFIPKMVKSFREASFVKGLFMKFSFYSMDYGVYPFYFIAKPSLYSQFVLMKQVSLIVHKINRQSLFVLNIRLNMLFVLWLSHYKILGKRLIYLLDYLIDLKLRYYYMHYSYFDIKLFQKPFFNRTIVKQRIYFYLSIYSRKYKKCYILFKLLWVADFKCYMNLREAV
jgi:hypothetical protein